MTTEYSTSPQAVREYMSAHDRTAYWVQAYAADEYLSPSAPPSELDDWTPSSPISEAGSSHSLPPRMVLRYNDGRPDIPVPREELDAMYGSSRSRSGHTYDEYGSRSHHHSHSESYSRGRANSHAPAPVSYSHSGRHDDRRRRHRERSPSVPEEIRILPSDGTQTAPRSTAHYRSASLPRATDPSLHTDVPFIPELPTAPNPAPSRPRTPSRHAHSHAPTPHASQVTFAQQYDPRTGRPVNQSSHRNAPAAYPPAHYGHGAQYSPQQMYHYQPQMGPNGMMYSHSAPVYSSQHPYAPPVEASSSYHGRSDHADMDRRSRSRHGSHKGHNHSRSNSGAEEMYRTHSSTSYESGKSGSTYYVVPSSAAGHKVHVIKPSPEHSIMTATSTTKSVSSPHSPHYKKPFFQRLFGFAMFSSAGSTKGSTHGGRKLHRRHSTGNSGRPRVEKLHGAAPHMQHEQNSHLPR